MTSYAVPPEQPRRVHSGERATDLATGRADRIRRIHSGERATVANAGRSVVPQPARRQQPRRRG